MYVGVGGPMGGLCELVGSEGGGLWDQGAEHTYASVCACFGRGVTGGGCCAPQLLREVLTNLRGAAAGTNVTSPDPVCCPAFVHAAAILPGEPHTLAAHGICGVPVHICGFPVRGAQRRGAAEASEAESRRAAAERAATEAAGRQQQGHAAEDQQTHSEPQAAQVGLKSCQLMRNAVSVKSFVCIGLAERRQDVAPH